MRHRFLQISDKNIQNGCRRPGKPFLASVCIISMMAGLLLNACGKSSSYKQPEDDGTVYNVGIVSESGNEALEQGFKDACTSLFGKKHVNVITAAKTDGDGSEEAASLLDQNASVILTESDGSLSSAYALTKESEDTSIVSVNVQNIPEVIGTDDYKDADERTTGVNVTGISSMPYVADQLSELIEATPDMKSVGIMYSPDDTDSVKINRILENYLTEAGIEYREYILASDLYKSMLKDAEEGSTSFLNAIRNSDEIDPTAPQISENFGRIIHPEYTDAELLDWERKARKSFKNAPDSKVINTAVKQNSAIYVAGGAMDSKITAIVNAAEKAKIPVFGGDEKCGSEALVTLWCNPYDTGYKAGQMAYQILANGEKASDMSVTYQNRSSYAKLYNSDYAKELGIEFPKSFSEFYAYISMCTPGTNTRRSE